MKCGSVRSTMSIRLTSWSLNSEDTEYFFFFLVLSSLFSTSAYFTSCLNRLTMNSLLLVPMHSMISLLRLSLFLSRKESVQYCTGPAKWRIMNQLGLVLISSNLRWLLCCLMSLLQNPWSDPLGTRHSSSSIENTPVPLACNRSTESWLSGKSSASQSMPSRS